MKRGLIVCVLGQMGLLLGYPNHEGRDGKDMLRNSHKKLVSISEGKIQCGGRRVDINIKEASG
jgi:hypothetical protein